MIYAVPSVVSTPGYVVEDKLYVVETNLYDVATKLVWTDLRDVEPGVDGRRHRLVGQAHREDPAERGSDPTK